MPPIREIHGYRLGRKLGEGSFGSVFEATKSSTNEVFAIKIIPPAKTDKVMLEQESKNQQLLHHKHVVEIVDHFRENGATWIVMELMSGGDLFGLIERNVRMPESQVRSLFQQIIAGLEHCHVNKIAHRDLKPENILLDDAQNAKIGDFGLSANMDESKRLKGFYGTKSFAAPELLTRSCPFYQGPEVDIWSCGVILFELLCSRLPFEAEEESDMCLFIRQGRFDVPGHVSTEAKDLIKRMLTVNPVERISLSDIKAHPWFTKDLPTDLFPRCVGVQYDVEAMKTRSASIESISTQSSLCNHHHQNEKAYFDGVWVVDGNEVASIAATSLVWADGAGRVAITTTGKNISMNYHGSECTAVLQDDGKLYWSDGDIWERQVLE